MSNQRGWVRIERTIRDLPIWPRGRRYSEIEAWLDLKIDIRIKDEIVDRGGVEIHVPAGSLLTDQVHLAERWRWDRKTVRKFLDRLVNRGSCLIKTKRGVGKGYTLITFVEDKGFSYAENSDSPMMDRENSPSDSPSNPHKVSLDNTETVGMVGIYPEESPAQEDLIEAAQAGDYWSLISKESGPKSNLSEAQLLMNMKPWELELVARVKAIFGKPAVVVAAPRRGVNDNAPSEESDIGSRAEQLRVLKELIRLRVPDHEAIELAKRGSAVEINKALRNAQRRAALAIPSSMGTKTAS